MRSHNLGEEIKSRLVDIVADMDSAQQQDKDLLMSSDSDLHDASPILEVNLKPTELSPDPSLLQQHSPFTLPVHQASPTAQVTTQASSGPPQMPINAPSATEVDQHLIQSALDTQNSPQEESELDHVLSEAQKGLFPVEGSLVHLLASRRKSPRPPTKHGSVRQKSFKAIGKARKKAQSDSKDITEISEEDNLNLLDLQNGEVPQRL